MGKFSTKLHKLILLGLQSGQALQTSNQNFKNAGGIREVLLLPVNLLHILKFDEKGVVEARDRLGFQSFYSLQGKRILSRDRIKLITHQRIVCKIERDMFFYSKKQAQTKL